MISKYLNPEILASVLKRSYAAHATAVFLSMAGTVSYSTISKIRDALSSIFALRSMSDYLNKKSAGSGLRLPLDKRPRQPKPTITPDQFHALLELVPEPYASMLFVSVWTGLRVSELIGLKWRCIHTDSITVEERFCRGDWSVPKTSQRRDDWRRSTSNCSHAPPQIPHRGSSGGACSAKTQTG
jgi:integrase